MSAKYVRVILRASCTYTEGYSNTTKWKANYLSCIHAGKGSWWQVKRGRLVEPVSTLHALRYQLVIDTHVRHEVLRCYQWQVLEVTHV